MHWTLGQEAWVWDVARSLCCVLRENTQPLQYGILVGNVVMNWHPIQGGVVILLLTSCLGKWDKFQLDGPLTQVQTNFFTYLDCHSFCYVTCLPLPILIIASLYLVFRNKHVEGQGRNQVSQLAICTSLRRTPNHRSGTGWGSNCQCAWLLISFVIIMIIFVCCDSPNTEKHNIFLKFFL